MKKSLLILLLLMTSVIYLNAATIISETLRDGSLPTNWSQTDIVFVTTADGYARFSSTNAILTTPVIDLSGYTNVQLTFDVAKYGTGTDGPITVEISDDGGSSWDAQTYDSPTPTGSTYLTSGPTTINATGSNIKIRLIRSNSPSQKRVRDFLLTGTASSTPTITLSESSLSGFIYEEGNGPSAEQTFTAEGSNLTADISIAAPTNYEISKTSESGYTTPLILTQSGGTVNSTTIYVRLKAGLSVGDYNSENITASSSGATNKTVTCSGSVSEETPDLMISKVADPENNVNARFVQLYNASGSLINFGTETWYLSRQANGSPTSWGDLQLTGSITNGGIFLIGYGGDNTNFYNAYGFNPDMASGHITGNGDDGYFLFYDGDHSSGTLVDAYGVIDQDGSGQPWEYENSKAVRNAGTTEPNTTWTASEWTITAADVADCDPGSTTLPVTLSTFTAQYLNSKPTLYWQTQSEEDNMGWFIYRNTIENFTSSEKISGMLPGHGTTTQPQSYIYEDAEQLQVEQTYYYWLESVDYSGTIHHFDMVANVTIPHTNDPGQNVTPPAAYEITADPNPFSYTTNITFAMNQTSLVDLAIYNVRGQLVKSFGTVMTNVDEEVSFQWNGKDNAGKSLSNGVYLYVVKVNGKNYATKQLILMK
jgi:hypothetical protein